jgi:cytoskeletal protein RodZ
VTELGQRLKEARLEKNYTYEELQELTKIQKRYLQAIEEGNYSVLPGAFYAKAFIKNYAEKVGLDPEELFEQYPSDLPVTSNDANEFTPRSTRVSASVPKDNKLSTVFPLILTILLIGALLVGLYWFFVNNNDNTGQEPVKDEVDSFESDVSKEQPEDQASKDDDVTTEGEKDDTEKKEDKPETETKPQQTLEKVSTDGNTTTYKLSNAAEFNVQIKTTGSAYIDVKNKAGEYIQPGLKTFKKGETLNYKLSDETMVTFNIGASQSVQMTINGEPFTFPIPPTDQPHQKIVIEYTKSATDTQ